MGRKQKLKNELAGYFEAPAPQRKREFFRATKMRRLHIPHILLIQTAYISKWVWVVSLLTFGTALFISRYLPGNMMGAVYAILPFFVPLSVSESMRSVTCGMKELELSARFSLKSVITARMGILGTGNLLLALALAAAIQGNFWRNAVYILVPYLFTAYVSLAVIRRVPGKEGTYLCGAVALLAAVGELAGFRYAWIYETRYIAYWCLAAAVCFYLTVRESFRTVRKAGEFIWN